VIIVGISPAQELDLVGPLNVFSIANDVLEKGGSDARPYAPEVVSGGSSRTIAGQSGLALRAARRFDEVRGTIDTLLIAGGTGALEKISPRLLAWIKARAGRVRRLGSVCTGAFVLAEAGLLRGRRVATHWAHAEALAKRHSSITVDPAPIWIQDRNIYTSAGICAGMDLALALVEEDHGSEVALAVARHLVVYLRRPGGQAQFSNALAGQASEKHEFRELASWIIEHPREDLRIPALAERANMSERHFIRAFSHAVGVSPGRFVESSRYDYARSCLESSSASLDEVANRCGYASAEVLRRTFLRKAGVTPNQYRDRFSARPGAERVAPRNAARR
jgi:transcriptional regulator GlxA family with amidase domain